MLHWVWNPARQPDLSSPTAAVTTTIAGSAKLDERSRILAGPIPLWSHRGILAPDSRSRSPVSGGCCSGSCCSGGCCSGGFGVRWPVSECRVRGRSARCSHQAAGEDASVERSKWQSGRGVECPGPYLGAGLVAAEVVGEADLEGFDILAVDGRRLAGGEYLDLARVVGDRVICIRGARCRTRAGCRPRPCRPT